MFRIFGYFPSDDPTKVRVNMIEHVTNDKVYYDSVACIALSFKGITLDYWIEDMGELNTFGDEISLYALCRMYNQHSIIYTCTKSWSTMGTVIPVTSETAHNNCDIHLLHMGCGVFEKLTMKPLNMSHKVEFGHLKIHMFIDKRKKAVLPDNLCCLYRDSLT